MNRDPAPSPIRINPNLAETDRDKVATLIRQLQVSGDMQKAKDALRGLIDGIVLQPAKTRRQTSDLSRSCFKAVASS